MLLLKGENIKNWFKVVYFSRHENPLQCIREPSSYHHLELATGISFDNLQSQPQPLTISALLTSQPSHPTVMTSIE